MILTTIEARLFTARYRSHRGGLSRSSWSRNTGRGVMTYERTSRPGGTEGATVCSMGVDKTAEPIGARRRAGP
jgi:hypothetical protein